MLPRLLLFLVVGAGVSAQVPGVSEQDFLNQQKQELIGPADREQVLKTLISQLHEYYILPDVAERMIAALQANERNGAYDTQFAGPAFASRLTDDLQGISHDKHLRVQYSLSPLPAEDSEPSVEDRAQYKQELDQSNCGFQALAILPGNIAYFQITYFGAPESCADTVATAMSFISHANALIFDVRQNRGGDPRMVALLESYLFDHPVHVNDIFNRKENKTTQYWTKPVKIVMPTQKVYILTSRMTFSAAEQLCYDLKSLGRAMLIGERTGGAAHPVRNRRINDHFLLSMPEYRYISPTTSSDWEGVGVTPDVPAAPWNAVRVADQMARTRLAVPVTPVARTSAAK